MQANFFGEVFDKRAGMLFAARRNEDGNVHRRDGVSKTVTKNMWAGLFKNLKSKEGPKEAPFRGKNISAETAERSFPDLILKGISCFSSALFPQFDPLTLKSAFRTAQIKKISGFQPDSKIYQPDVLMNQPSCSEDKPERLEVMHFLTTDDAPLTLQHADAFKELTKSSISLTPPSIPTPDEGVKTPSTPDVRTTHFDAWLLAVPVLTLDAFVQLLATKGRHLDADVFWLEKTVYC